MLLVTAGAVYLFDGTTGDLLLTIPNPTSATSEFFGGAVATTPTGNFLVEAVGDIGHTSPGAVYLIEGIPDDEDECPNSDLSPTVVIDGCDSEVDNTLFVGDEDFGNGCTISDLIAECAEDVGNHGKFVSCVAKLTNDLKKAGIISGKEKGTIQSCAA